MAGKKRDADLNIDEPLQIEVKTLFDPCERRHNQYHSFLHGAIPSYVVTIKRSVMQSAIVKDFL
jgi:hypothetical protein